MTSSPALWTSIIGFFFGFGFGVGCALAVMYSIYLHGYRAAVRDASLPQTPQRLLQAREKLAQQQAKAART